MTTTPPPVPERRATRVKICCISSLDEASLAVAVGAHALGLVSAMPSGPGVIDEALIARIAARIAADGLASVQTFLLTSKVRASEIIQQHHHCRTTTLQLVDAVPPDELRRLRDALPGVPGRRAERGQRGPGHRPGAAFRAGPVQRRAPRWPPARRPVARVLHSGAQGRCGAGRTVICSKACAA